MVDIDELDMLDVGRLVVVVEEVDNGMVEVLAADDEDDDAAVDEAEETGVESTAYTLILQLAPHNCVLSPPHLAEQSVSGTLALFDTAFNSFPQ